MGLLTLKAAPSGVKIGTIQLDLAEDIAHHGHHAATPRITVVAAIVIRLELDVAFVTLKYLQPHHGSVAAAETQNTDIRWHQLLIQYTARDVNVHSQFSHHFNESALNQTHEPLPCDCAAWEVRALGRHRG